MRRRPNQGGQALVEAAIIMPVLVLIIVGGVQVALIAHGRVLSEHAAYCAVRAGIVHNAHWQVMRNAALVCALPLYKRTDSLDRLLGAWAQVKTSAKMGEAIDRGTATLERLGGALLGVSMNGLFADVSLVEIRVTSPSSEVLRLAGDLQQRLEARSRELDAAGGLHYPTQQREIDVDDPALLASYPELTRLAVETRVLFPLRVPLANKLIFELVMLHQHLRGAGRAGPAVEVQGYEQWAAERAALRRVAERHGVYLLPLTASYAMHMQSNLFIGNQREPGWFKR